jgi:hypothetical protein
MGVFDQRKVDGGVRSMACLYIASQICHRDEIVRHGEEAKGLPLLRNDVFEAAHKTKLGLTSLYLHARLDLHVVTIIHSHRVLGYFKHRSDSRHLPLYKLASKTRAKGGAHRGDRKSRSRKHQQWRLP